MKSKIVTATLALCCLSPSFSYAQSTAPTIADEVIFTLSSETLTSPRAVVEHPKADFIKLHFKSLNLPQGSAIRLTSRDALKWCNIQKVSSHGLLNRSLVTKC